MTSVSVEATVGNEHRIEPLVNSAAPAPTVRVRDLVKRFRRADGSEVAAVDHVDLEVLPGQFTVLLGPSGCGKTTLLRCIAGLERPIAGSIEIGGRTVFDSSRGIDVRPEKRGVNMIFQSYALWPHMTAGGNVAYPLRCRRVRKAEIAERVGKALAMVGIPELIDQYPSQMSGGQQQRVALARAIVSNSELVLFDEPLSNVDAKIREQLRLELISMQRELGFSAVYVTHDQTEAMELAHSIAVLDSGHVAQIGPPREIYEQPATRYVADFIGTINEVGGTVVAVRPDGTGTVDTSVGRLEVTMAEREAGPGDRVCVLWRPERTRVHRERPSAGTTCWRGVVEASFFSGAHTEHVVAVEGVGDQRVWRPDPETIPDGTPVWVEVAARDLRALGEVPTAAERGEDQEGTG